MTSEKLNELIGYIKPVDLSFLGPHESEIYARYRRGLATAVSADGVTEVGGACDFNREEVRRLRLDGMEPGEIAEQTGIPQEQVEIYCHQLGLPLVGSCRICLDGVEVEKPREQKCLNCGLPLPARRRKFCCRSCMEAYRYQQRKTKERESND